MTEPLDLDRLQRLAEAASGPEPKMMKQGKMSLEYLARVEAHRELDIATPPEVILRLIAAARRAAEDVA